MKKKIFLVVFAFAMLFTQASAQYYTITSHTIEIQIDEEGFAQISEKFFLEFPNEFQLKDFREKNAEIGISLDQWKEFDSRIHTYIGKETEINRGEVGFIENSEKYLELKYSLNQQVAEKLNETSRLIEFSFLNKFFDQFVQGGVIIIPANTTITIKLPVFAEIEKPVKPEAIINGTQLIWQGYKSSNILDLKYRLVKQIANISLGEILNALMQSQFFYAIIAGIAVIIGITIIKRKTLSEKIEDYIVANSELGQKNEIEGEEEKPTN